MFIQQLSNEQTYKCQSQQTKTSDDCEAQPYQCIISFIFQKSDLFLTDHIQYIHINKFNK